MRLAPVVLVATLAVMTAGFAEAPPPPMPGLEHVPDAKVKLAYVRPGTDWRKFRSIQLQALSIPTAARNTKPSGARTDFGESYLLRDKDVTDIQDAYNTAMRDVLGEAGFAFVDQPRADTLIVAAQVINITLVSPIESTRQSYMSRGRTFTKNGGSMTMGAVLADGGSGQIIAEAVDRKVQTDIWHEDTRVRNLADARRAFREWAMALRDRLKGG